MPDDLSFESRFRALTGHDPFPWQIALHGEFMRGKFPEACDIPTGLGKTSIIPIWLLALAERGGDLPRRLVYVVNRRTVVDQATAEAEAIRAKLRESDEGDLSPEIAAIRRGLGALPGSDALAISTLRGQFADNRQWSADPSRPAVIVGTVDMIGSRLLFGGYGLGFKTRPLHAGFLGQDALLVHDEAHLEPAFQKLIEAIRAEQDREFATRPDPLGGSMRLKVMALTATPRSGELFGLTAADQVHPEVRKRIKASKQLILHPLKDHDTKDNLSKALADIALTHKDSRRAVLVFARKIEDITRVADKLRKEGIEPCILTGTMRGWEREELLNHPVFKRFLPNAEPGEKAVYLVSTSAGEVGVNITADHMACDLSTFESMAQRFGRVNRFGVRDDTRIDVIHPEANGFDENTLGVRLRKTLVLLTKLEGDGRPDALSRLDPVERLAAFSPPPTILKPSDILFDAWSLTTIRDELPGRPPLEPYLHGLSEWEPPETQVAWRDDVQWLVEDRWTDLERAEFLDDFPIKPHELLRDRSDRVFKHVETIARRFADGPPIPAWLIDQMGKVHSSTVQEFADKDRKDQFHNRILLLPPETGGLRQGGLLDGSIKEHVLDVSSKAPSGRRERLWDDQKPAKGMRLIRSIDLKHEIDDTDQEPDDSLADEDAEGAKRETKRAKPPGHFWHWYEQAKSADDEGSENAERAVILDDHTADVVREAEAIVARLTIPQPIKDVVIWAAQSHDTGKNRRLFQRKLGNFDLDPPLAKAGKRKPGEKERRELGSKFRHEFGSLLDFKEQSNNHGFTADQIELAEHLVATHHGRGRPHFSSEEAFDPKYAQELADGAAAEVPRRFARLQRKYGRWGLAYLESLLRAADYAASAQPSKYVGDES